MLYIKEPKKMEDSLFGDKVVIPQGALKDTCC